MASMSPEERDMYLYSKESKKSVDVSELTNTKADNLALNELST
jgi:hypothetical protein